ncbi:TPA: hypothetical protein QH740_001280, partial [Klebsiella michiganensis]|nr:hypothetical protein [Klebsiella michiganensis]HDS8616375.1 hypothetical protein [Klebsiella michiganensis]
MTRYNTGYPVPSPAMPDMWDNNETIDSFVNSPESSVTTRTGIVRDTMFGMQKKADEQRIAASVALAEQMDSQESAFNAAQTDKEDRFQGFLNSSGYVFLGNYENGPFQFSARNQYIRYNNQYYRLNAATDIGFTTTGTDANSFANDVTHFVLMDGDTLRQDLGSSEGFKLLGQVRSAAALAALAGEDGDRVLLLGYHDGWAASSSELSGGGEFHYVSSLADVNNAITIFNGWCRKFTDTVITT